MLQLHVINISIFTDVQFFLKTIIYNLLDYYFSVSISLSKNGEKFKKS